MSRYTQLIEAARVSVRTSMPTPDPQQFLRSASAALGRARWRARIAQLAIVLVFALGVVRDLGSLGLAGSQVLELLVPAVLRSGVATFGILSVAVWLVARPGFGPGLLVRALLWPFMVSALFGAVAGLVEVWPLVHNPYALITQRWTSWLQIPCLGVAIRLLPRMEELGPDPRARFSPVAFRGLLTLSLVLVIADATMLIRAAAGSLLVVPAVFAVALLAIAYALYRMKTWALFAAWIANPLILIVMRDIAMSDTVSENIVATGHMLSATFVLATTTVVQLLLPVPVFVAMLRGRVIELPWLNALGAGALRLLLLLFIGSALVPVGLAVWRASVSSYEDPCAQLEPLAQSRGCFRIASWERGEMEGGTCVTVCDDWHDVTSPEAFGGPPPPVPDPCDGVSATKQACIVVTACNPENQYCWCTQRCSYHGHLNSRPISGWLDEFWRYGLR